MAKGHTPGPWRYEAATRTIRSSPANYWLASMDSWDGAVIRNASLMPIAGRAGSDHRLSVLGRMAIRAAEGMTFDEYRSAFFPDK